VSRWVPGEFVPLGTDGFGRSDTREALRSFFEIDAEHIAAAALAALARQGKFDPGRVRKALQTLQICHTTPNPWDCAPCHGGK